MLERMLRLTIPDRVKEKMLWKNAVKILGLIRSQDI